MKQQTIDLIKKEKIIAIIRGVTEEKIIQTVEALYNGGICLVEITFNQKDNISFEETPNLIKKVISHFGDKICVGAGTVMTEEQCIKAVKAGAKYIISPNTDELVIKKSNELGVVSIPGALTPTEASFAYKSGADFVKLFPACDLGKNYVKSVLAPLNHIPFLAVGSVCADELSEYLDIGVVGFGIGSKLIKKDAILDNDFNKITKNAQEYVKALVAF